MALDIMFKLALVLSTVPSANLFRAVLEGAFHSAYFDNFLICSGFFQERTTKKGSFYASSVFAPAALPLGSSVTVVGAYDPASREFNTFVANLVANLKDQQGNPVPIEQRRALRQYANKWHAKIFIAKHGKRCEFAVIGSSNLTRSAFDAQASNNEADVIIWNDSDRRTRALVDRVLTKGKSGLMPGVANPAVIVGNYDVQDRRNSARGAMPNRLAKLWKDVVAATRK